MRILLCSFLLISTMAVPGRCDEAEYRLRFEGGWTLQPLPNGAHFTSLIGATHAKDGEIFAVGGMASPGVENVAELGNTTLLTSEINQKIQNGSVGSLILRPGNIGPSSVVTIDFTVDNEHHKVSLLTMIAPSPDWFVGFSSFDLRKNNQWISDLTLPLNSYDAGTEEGDSFSLNNPATSPQSTIEMLDFAEPSNPLFGFGSIATVTITRLDNSDFPVGDVNRDGIIDLLDISPFVDVLTSGSFQIEADVNCDGEVTLLDVQPFVNLMTN